MKIDGRNIDADEKPQGPRRCAWQTEDFRAPIAEFLHLRRSRNKPEFN